MLVTTVCVVVAQGKIPQMRGRKAKCKSLRMSDEGRREGEVRGNNARKQGIKGGMLAWWRKAFPSVGERVSCCPDSPV